jgi:putative flippase GtrA
MNKLRGLLQNQHVRRYLIVGVGVYLLELGVILVAQSAGANNVVAVALAFWSGLIVSFLLQKFFTFQDKRTHHKIVAAQFLAVTALVLWNFGFTLLFTKLTSDHLPATVARTIALAITTIWNFQLYRISIFRGPENQIY